MDNPYDIPLTAAHPHGEFVGAQPQRRRGQPIAGINGPPRCTIESLALSLANTAVFGSPSRHTTADCT